MIEIETPADRSVRRGRRAVVAATIAALIAGTAGFLVGRSSDDADRGVGAVPTTPPPTDPQETTTGDTTPADPTPPDAPVATTVPMSIGAEDSAAARGGPGMYSPNAYEEQAMELMGERTTSSGVVMKAYFGPYEDMMYGYGTPPGWKPAGWCFPRGNIRVSIVAPTSVQLAYAAWFAELKDGLSVTTFASGYVEGSPMFGAIVQVDPDAILISMTTASGRTDSAAPSNGIGLLVVDGELEEDVTFTVSKSDGTFSVNNVAELLQPYASTEFHSACDPPPPALPDAGAQPADPAAAGAAIRANWSLVHNGDLESRAAYLDDATGVVDAWTALQEGDFAEAAANSTAPIGEIVFTSETEAWFRYDVLTPITNFYDRYGMARLESEGTWVFTRQTICQDISLAPGASCSPPVDVLLPPSAATDPRYNPQLINEGDIVGD